MIRSVLLLLLFCVASLVACSDADLRREAHPPTLANTAWRAVEINGEPTVAGSEPTATFKIADVTGSGGCNDWFASYRYDPSNGRITFDRLGMTARACAKEAAVTAETKFAKVLTTVNQASIDPAGRLALSGPDGEIVFEVAPLPG
jgi:heat shock protein HslJ